MLKEQEIIKKFRELILDQKAAQNFEDDVAIISPKENSNIIISKDIMVENVHFLTKNGGYKIAKKLLASNLSDLACTGAKPLYYVLGFSKNEVIDKKFLDDFCLGLKETQNEFNIGLVGGDVVNSTNLFFSITIFGEVEKQKNLSRKNAKENDLIFVSEYIGDSFLGFHSSKTEKNEKKDYEKELEKKHYFANPRINLGRELLKNQLSNCATDISDGLLIDLKSICESAKLSANIFLDRIPISENAKKYLNDNSNLNILDLLSGGEDYELIFSTHKDNREKILKLAKKLKIKLSEIGFFAKKTGEKINLFDSKNNKIKIEKFGYEH
jgi:thiamine-monophosphate kinase